MSSRNLSDADEHLAAEWLEIRNAFEDMFPGRSAIVTCTYRSPEEQQALYAQGRTAVGPIVTQLDGVTHKSNHNVHPSRALDFCVVVNGKVSWDPIQYEPVGRLAEDRGLVWGGRWPTFKDYPHIEMAGGNPK